MNALGPFFAEKISYVVLVQVADLILHLSNTWGYLKLILLCVTYLELGSCSIWDILL